MITELDVVPVFSGVVYSPGWTGWKFYPEEQLFVGQTGGGQNQTYIRSVIVFSLPDLPPGAILLKAFLRLRITRNEPLDVQKHICLREAPRNPHATWSIDEELSMPFVSEHHLSTEIGLDLDFELTAQVDVWRDGGPNNGIVLNQASFSQSLVAFAGAGASEPQPTLKLAYVLPSSRDETVTMWVGPDTAKDSQEFPCSDLVVRNLGPGLAWVSPLYLLEREFVDPAGIPLGVLDPGAYMLIKPRLPARRMAVRIDTALSETSVTIIPSAQGKD